MTGWRKRQILSKIDEMVLEIPNMEDKIVIVKVVINRYLQAMLGRPDLVDAWWDSKNKAFDGKTPNELYLSGAEGRNRVYHYVIGCSDGYW